MRACGRCGQLNAEGQRFCGGCGIRLAVVCPACGQINDPDFRFCGSCGSPLDDGGAPRSDAGPVEERRWATALFADLSGFTSRSETLDPEEVTLLVDRCMQRLGEAIDRYGGVVANVAGDGLLAVFGVPKAHEDDPERAVRAALEMQRCAREYSAEFDGLELRVGVNTGEMMFATVGPEAHRTPTVYGDAVNTASRLEGLAPVGGVLVGDETYRATSSAFVYEAVTPLDVKGKAAPVAAWIAEDVKGAPAGRVVSSVPMIGRDLELDLLTRTWERAVAERRPRLATIVGPAGIGKTRLVDEFLNRIAAGDAATAAVYSGRCLPYGHGITYWPLREILWSAAGIPFDDTAQAAAAGLRQLIARLAEAAGMRDEERERTTFALATTCGVPLPDNPLERMSPESVAEEVGLAWPRFLSALASERPTAIVIEDLHWAEPPLLQMIERILARSDGRLLVVATARPEFADVSPGWTGAHGMAQIPLEPLTDEESQRLLSQLLPEAAIELYEKVVATAEGNPFFTEEIARHLATAGFEPSASIPSTVWALLATRIDALADEEKSLLQDAAVVGRSFWPAALEAMRPRTSAHQALRSLEEQGLIVTRPTSSLPGETELWFRHALIRDVAYRSIPKRRRATAHAAVASWIDELVGDRRGEFIDLLAHHYESAATPDVADLAWPDGSAERDAIRAKAVEALLQAGGAAARQFATDDALRFAERALALASGEHERLAALELRARAFHASVNADDALDSYLEALELARAIDDRDAVFRLMAFAALLCARYSGAFTRERWRAAAVAIVEDGLAELGESAESFEVGALLVGRSRVPRWLSASGDRAQARRDAERAIEIAEALNSPYLLSYAIEALSQPTVQDGFCEGEAIATRLMGVAETLSDRIEAQETRVLATLHFSRAERYEAARAAADEAAREAVELSPHRRLHAACAQTVSLLVDGDLRRLRESTARVPELIHEDGGRVCPYGAVALAGHALTLFEAGEEDAAAAAVALVDRAVEGAEGPTLLFRAAEIIRPLATVDAARSRLRRIERSSDTVPRIHELRAALQVHALAGDSALDDLIAEARALAGPACAPSLAALADWAESVELARSGSSASALEQARRAASELEAHGDRYPAARLMTDLLPFLDEGDAAAAAAETVERLGAMNAHATLTEALRYVRD